MGEEKIIIQNIEENPGMAIGNVQGDVKIDKRKIIESNLIFREVVSDFWFVRAKTFKILILSFLICFAATIYNGIIFIDSDNGFNSFVFGILGILITLLYFFFFKMFEKEEVKKHKIIRNDYRKLWLKLDLLFIVAMFWVLL